MTTETRKHGEEKISRACRKSSWFHESITVIIEYDDVPRDRHSVRRHSGDRPVGHVLMCRRWGGGISIIIELLFHVDTGRATAESFELLSLPCIRIRRGAFTDMPLRIETRSGTTFPCTPTTSVTRRLYIRLHPQRGSRSGSGLGRLPGLFGCTLELALGYTCRSTSLAGGMAEIIRRPMLALSSPVT